MRLSVAVQTHPVRREMAAALAASINGAELVFDPIPEGVRNPWRTYRLALERTPAGVSHRIILQDDSEPCRDFQQVARSALTAQPDRLVVFFVGGRPYEHSQAVYRACNLDRSWAELRNDKWCPAVALAWPVRLIEPFLAFVDEQNWPETFTADDEIICRYLQSIQERPLATVPSLVEHPDVAHPVNRRNSRPGAAGGDPGRVAACLVCDDCDPRRIDWNAGPA